MSEYVVEKVGCPLVRVRARVRVRVWLWVGSRRSAAGPSLNPPADYLLPPYSPLIRP